MSMGIYLVVMALCAFVASVVRRSSAESRDDERAAADAAVEGKFESRLREGEKLYAFCCMNRKETAYVGVTNQRVLFLGDRTDSIPFERIKWFRLRDGRGYDTIPERAIYMTIATDCEKIQINKISLRFEDVAHTLQNGVKLKKSIF